MTILDTILGFAIENLDKNKQGKGMRCFQKRANKKGRWIDHSPLNSLSELESVSLFFSPLALGIQQRQINEYAPGRSFYY